MGIDERLRFEGSWDGQMVVVMSGEAGYEFSCDCGESRDRSDIRGLLKIDLEAIVGTLFID